MNEIYLFGDSAAQGIVLDESENYRVSRAGCIRLMKHSGYPIRNYAVHGYTVNQGLESFRNLKTDPEISVSSNSEVMIVIWTGMRFLKIRISFMTVKPHWSIS